MGYKASGSGTFRLKAKSVCKFTEEFLDKLSNLSSCEFYIDKEDPTTLVAKISERWNFWSDEFENALESILPYIEDGEVHLSGEDGQRWRYKHMGGEFICETALDYFPSDEDTWKSQFFNLLNELSQETKEKKVYVESGQVDVYSGLSNKILTPKEAIEECMEEVRKWTRA